MELSVQVFLDSVTNPNTKKEYRHGIKKFCDWYGRTAEEVLELRKNDLTQIAGEGLVEYRNRAARFEREIEKFHSYLIQQKHTINTARNLTLGIRQLFRYYEMGIRFRAGSRVTKTVKTTKNFPLTIEHVRTMFQVADLRERVILSTATDLGLRIGDFLALKKTDLPPLDQEPPISFVIMTEKEDVVAHSFLSQETTDLLKVYLPTLERKNGNPYLFPSNGKSHISDEWMNRLLQRLAEKAKIDLNGKDLTFHCFRKMFLSASVDSGIGMTAGKMLCGKAIAQSDDTYLTTVNLRQKFILLKKFLAINEQPKIETQKLEILESAVCKLQEELTQQKQITESISKENVKTKEELRKLQPLVEFINSFDAPENLKTILSFLKDDFLDEYADERPRPLRVEFSPYISKRLEEIAKTTGIDETEALRQLVEDDLKTMENAEERFKKIEQRTKRSQKPSDKTPTVPL
ncbi:MAG TPA: tyrosine-type recombinase/integrase [Candidatus Bathyarchaeia archaeon]|nr:tyrosine-type recombinase/integrase [Candidatus Bathyarchaeia archaeon]